MNSACRSPSSTAVLQKCKKTGPLEMSLLPEGCWVWGRGAQPSISGGVNLVTGMGAGLKSPFSAGPEVKDTAKEASPLLSVASSCSPSLSLLFLGTCLPEAPGPPAEPLPRARQSLAKGKSARLGVRPCRYCHLGCDLGPDTSTPLSLCFLICKVGRQTPSLASSQDGAWVWVE